MFRRIALFVFLVLNVGLLSAAFAAEDEVDREIGRVAAAKAVADVLFTDEAYSAMVGQFATSAAMQGFLEGDGFDKAVAKDQAKAQEAVMEATKEFLPKADVRDGMAAALADAFTYGELKEVLTFIRSDVGRKYSALAYSQHFYELAFEAIFKKSDGDPRPALARAFKMRFPNMKFGR